MNYFLLFSIPGPNKKLKYSLIIALFRSLPNCILFQRRFTITPLAIIRPEHSRTISGPMGYIHRCYQTIFPGAHKVETVLSCKMSTWLRTVSTLCAPGKIVW